MTISFGIDDFGPSNHRFDLLTDFHERYPKCKITLFTIAWDIRFNPNDKGSPITDKKFDTWCETTRQAIKDGWIEIAIHGLTHKLREFENLTFDEAKKRVLVAQKMFVNRNIPTIPIFKAPQWMLSSGGKKAIEELGLKVVEDHYYNWNLKDNMPKSENIIAHGHIQNELGTQNGLEQSFMKLCKIPPDSNWIFLSEVLL